MSRQMKEGIDSISSSLNELKKFGYIKYTKLSTGYGVYELFDEPNQENPNQENPNQENPNQDNPNLGKPNRISNTDLIVIKIDSNKDKYLGDFEKLWKSIKWLKKGDKKRALSRFKRIMKDKTYTLEDIKQIIALENNKKDYHRHFITILNSDILDGIKQGLKIEASRQKDNTPNIIPMGQMF